MYLLTWNEQERTVYAGIGGVVTLAESQVLSEELFGLLDAINDQPVVELDATKASRFADGALEEVEKIRFVLAQRGLTARLQLEEKEEFEPMSARVREIMFGPDEEFSEFRIAS